MLGASAAANEPADIVRRAFASIDTDTHRSWAFTETSTEDEQTWVGRYDPSEAEDRRWTLLSVDGREPTRDEREDYVRDRHDEFEDDEDDDDGSEMIDFETYRSQDSGFYHEQIADGEYIWVNRTPVAAKRSSTGVGTGPS